MTKRLLLSALIAAISFGAFAQYTNDIALTKVKMPDYAQFSEQYVMGVFKNKGTDSLFNMDVFWQANEGRIYKYHKDNFAIKSGQSWIFTHPDKVEFDKSMDYTIKVWVANPNGETDENPVNDTIYHTVQVIEKYPERKLLIEEITGAWCGYCPRAPIIFNKIIKPKFPQVIFVAIHTGDAMQTNDSKALRDAYVEGVPTGFVSREVVGGYTNVALSPESWEGRLEDLDLEFNPVGLQVYNYFYPDTREWKIDVIADFVLDTEGDFRFNIYVIEDSLTGTGSQWNQRNFFNSSASDPFMELQGAGDPLPGYVHNHVVRKMTAGSWGKSGIIPDSVKRGESYIYSETFTIPESWKPEHLHVLGIVQKFDADKSKRPILNVKESELSYATGTEPIIKNLSISLYPNPVSDEAFLEVETIDSSEMTFEVLNSIGQTILKSGIIPVEGKKRFLINTASWQPGVYFVRTMFGDEVQVLKMVK